MNPGVVITGPGRSGTSLVARTLEVCGLYLGTPQQLMPGALGNPDGYWEHTGIVAVNDAILEHFDAGWDISPIKPRWEDPVLNDHREHAATLLNELAEHAHWGWKDPRMSFTLPFWHALNPGLKAILCLRHPAEVAASLHRYHHTSAAFGRKWWMDCVTATLDACHEKSLLIVDFNSLREIPHHSLRRLCNYCELSPDSETLGSAVALIKPSHQGHYETPPLPPPIETLYERLKVIAAA